MPEPHSELTSAPWRGSSHSPEATASPAGNPRPQVPAPWRDVFLFALGPALLAVIVATAFAIHPWPVPFAVQARSYDPRFFVPVLVLGALGVWLSSLIGLPSAPPFIDGRSWARLLTVSGLAGLSLLAISAIWDLEFNLSRIAAQAIGQTAINTPFPASIAHYSFGAVIEECLGRLIPIPILAWLVGTVALRGTYKIAVFWTVGVLASIVEPLSQATPLAAHAPGLAWIVGITEFSGTLVLLELFRRFGWPILILARLVQELGWHVAWPLISH
jgi:hypothetical protein